MSEPRKIVLILGNGFDLDLGLKTSYKDFWESEFCPKDYPAPLIHHLNQRWPDNLEAVKWYDLENELLNYYKSIPDPTKGQDIITEEERALLEKFTSYGQACGWYNEQLDLVQSLIDKGVLFYNGNILRHVDEHLKEDALKSPIWRDRKALGLIKDGLCKYLKSIVGQGYDSESVALNVLFAAETAREAGNFLNIYTFNYTELPVDYGDGFKDIIHYVHGSRLKEKIIVGTRDDQDIDSNYDFLQKSFDPHFNPPALVADLLDADEVIIFGHSIGTNDRQYFKAFFKQQTDYANPKRKDITIFTRDDESEVQIKRALQQMTDGNLSTLYGLNHIQVFKTANIKEQQRDFYNFLLKSGMDKRQASVQIGKILNKEG